MAYKTITVISHGKEPVTLSDKPKVDLVFPNIDVLPTAAGVSLAVPQIPNYFPDAVNRFLNQRPYVTSINGVKALDGGIWMHPDACMDWEIVNNEMVWTDMCPACESCDKQVSVKRRLESIKLMLNEMKDANLYEESIVQARWRYMTGQRMPASVACAAPEAESTRQTNQSYQLLKNYLTMLHMWNYAVNLVNSQNRIITAPEDATGFCVQTKHAVSSCSGKATLTCVIDVRGDQVQPDLSVYAVDPLDVNYSPFADPEYTFTPVKTIKPKKGETTTETDPTHKVATVVFNSIGRAGTYEVKFKLLPFIHAVVLYGANGTVNTLDFDQVDWNVLDSTSSGSSTDADNMLLNLGVCRIVKNVLMAPDEADYLNSRTFPSHAVTTTESAAGATLKFNRWKIAITWTLEIDADGDSTVDHVQSSAEEYYFETTLVQLPVLGLLQASGITSIDPTEPATD